MKPEKPSDFDWVTARAGCSALHMFELLKAETAKNVNAIKAITKANGQEMSLKTFENGNLFGVIRPHRLGEIGVRFGLYKDEIRVESLGQVLNVAFTATLTLNDEGECRFLVDGQTLDRWQALKGAASRAILGAGGTISHQHGVGRDHLPYLEAEKGALGVAAIRQLAAAFDPAGMLNPGKLV